MEVSPSIIFSQSSSTNSEPAGFTGKNLDWDSLFNKINPALFTMFDGNPIVFYFYLEDPEEIEKWKKLVVLGNGDYVDNQEDMDSRTAFMVDDLNPFKLHSRPSFKLSYIRDCVEKNSLLDIGDYLQNNLFQKSDLYMKVVFYGTETFKLRSSTERSNGNTGSNCSLLKVDKGTREPYTCSEKEAILKFLISKPNKRFGLNGDPIWKTMEVRNICPRRTYQSMKNHFRRFLLKELDRFEFLTDADKKFLRGESK